jgi:catechol 2,3-dioxygenase-like lactoylglutathione lyase family enzyme
MILGVDHIALSCSDLDAARARLAGVGAPASFVATDLPNPEAKAAVLRRFTATHQIAYCRPATGVAIELTQHGPAEPDVGGPGTGPFQVLVSGPRGTWAAEPVVPSPAWIEAFRNFGNDQGGEPTRWHWSDLGAEVWYDPDGPQQFAVRAVIVPTADPAASVRFWVEGLGAEVIAGAPDGLWTRVAFRRPVPAWSLDVLLVHSAEPAPPPLLDDPGFRCLALLVNRLPADLARAEAAGGRPATAPFELSVNGRALGVALVRGPAGELVEFLEVRRN